MTPSAATSRRPLFLRYLLPVLCFFCLAFFVTRVGASSFAPPREELDANPSQKAEASQELAGVTPTVDELGRWVYQVDDMLLVAEPGEPDNAFSGTRWPNGTVYYQFHSDVTTTNRAIWRDAAAAWSSAAALTFVESTGSGNYIYVQNSDGNSSYVGMIGGSQEMNIYSWNSKYIVAHEIGHALGLKHEQARPDRDTYVTIYFQNIEAGKEHNFDRDTTAQTYGQYDFESVMHYRRNAFTNNGQNTIEPTSPYSSYLNVIGQRSYLSSLDLSGMAQRYGGGSSAPSNDNFAGRRVISGTQSNVTGTNVGATRESAEPSYLVSNGGKSVWYSWTAPASGTATVDTQQSNFDTILAVYTGSSLSSLSVIATNDDSSTNQQSRVTFTATAGTVYQIAVDGWSAASGSIRLNWALTGITSTPANNNFANRQALSGFSGTVSGSNGGATKESGEPMHAQNQGGRSVWYSWTAPVTGVATFDTGESNFDTLLAVYTGTSVSALTPVASNDDSQEDLTSSVTFPATAGVNYKIAVDGYAGDSGSIQLHWVLSAPFPFPNGAVVAIQANTNGRLVVAESAGNSPLIANRTAIGDWEQFQLLDLGNGFMALRALANGLFVCAENAGNSALIANRPTIGIWEQFQMVNLGSGNFALIARANGKFVCAENAGASSLIANRTVLGGWEQFRMVFLPSVKPVNVILGLQSASTGKYVVAENAGGTALVANRDQLGSWEQFRLVDVGNGNVALQSVINGRYVAAENAGGSALIANRPTIGQWEQFQLLDVGNGHVALRAIINNRFVSTTGAGGILIANQHSVGATEQFAMNVTLRSQANGQFVVAESAGQQPLIANRPSIGVWEQFQIVNTGDGFFAMKAKANGRYVCAENAGQNPLIANRTSIGGWEQFQWVVGGNGNVALRAFVNGMFVSAENGGASPLIANRPSANSWEQFR